jgi:hypothetical protein
MMNLPEMAVVEVFGLFIEIEMGLDSARTVDCKSKTYLM